MDNVLNYERGMGEVLRFKNKRSKKNVYYDLWLWLHPRSLEYRINKSWYGDIEDEGTIRNHIYKFKFTQIDGEHFACIYINDEIQRGARFMLFINLKDYNKNCIPVYSGVYDTTHCEIRKADSMHFFDGDPYFCVYYAEGIISVLNQFLNVTRAIKIYIDDAHSV